MSAHEAVRRYFPYPEARPWQDSLMDFVYEALLSGKNAVAEGANGIGKTVAVLSSALPIARERGYRILYCARTHGQMDRVIEELKLIAGRAGASGVALRGRAGMCLHKLLPERVGSPREAMEACEQLRAEGRCPYYKGMHENPGGLRRLQRAVTSAPHTVSEIIAACRKEGLCPYEFIKLVLDQVDVVALSYVYLLDGAVRRSFLRNFTAPLSDFIVVVDEAHNLPGTAVEVMSRRLSLSAIERARKEAEEYGHGEVAELCRSLSGAIEEEEFDEELRVQPIELVDRLGIEEPLRIFDLSVGVGRRIARSRLSEGKRPTSYVRSVGEFFLRWMETADDPDYIHLLSRLDGATGEPLTRLEILALAPDRALAPVIRSIGLSVHVSGTLEPMDAYIKMVGLPGDTPCISLPSPFPRWHTLTLVCKGVRTDLEHRTPAMYRKLAERIGEAIRYTPGNVGIFAASYSVLEGLLDAGLEEASTKRIYRERRGASSRENDSLVRRFKSCASRGGAVLLGVQGGRNAEGRDYPGDLMNTSIVVGVPYAKPLPRMKAQEEYYERVFPGHGREYGYVVPALRRAAQAAGRPIRSLRDRGACIFLDYRFSTSYLRRYLPRWMRRNLRVLPDEEGAIAKELILFFGLRGDDTLSR